MSAVAQITFAILSHSRRNNCKGKSATDCLEDIKVITPPTHTHPHSHTSP